MGFSEIQITSLRNITNTKIDLRTGINVIQGDNGSGKSSVLESIFLLARGRSFRTSRASHLIKKGNNSLVVFGQYTDNNKEHKIGIRKSSNTTELHLNGSPVKQLSRVVRLIPLQLITPKSYQILDSGPLYRRKLIDWGVFHVEHQYVELITQFKKLQLQRNRALKDKPEIASAWDKEYSRLGEQISKLRARYTTQLIEISLPIINRLTQLNNIEIAYHRGWSKEHTLEESLSAHFQTDLSRGFTSTGPQRADLSIKIESLPAEYFASRGQQKLIITAIMIAQSILHRKLVEQPTTILVDDLIAELDTNNREKIIHELVDTDCQIVLTSIINERFDYADKVFHVKHGEIIPAS